ncbi:MAG TPA: 3-hydroxyacyl-ACP dehydratase FabZ, partial [bacterium]|nr:3-hydroxyacyl-ACP dehydratase FabZ [bacterium]
PVLDGSARPFLALLDEADRQEQGLAAVVFRPREVMSVTANGDILLLLPAPDLKVTYLLHYDCPSIGSQYYSVTVTPETFAAEIAPARTFGLKEEVDALYARKLAKGGSLENAVVFAPEGPLNPEGLRFPNEPVRHKILDLLGDMALAGVRVQGHFIGIRSGHYLNVQLMHKIRSAMPLAVPGLKESFGKCDITFDVTAIQRILPHRYPFLLVDKIIGMEEDRKVVGIKNVTINEPFFNGHFPGHPVMPGVLVIEAMAQVGGVMLLSRTENSGKLVYFMGLDGVRWRKPIVPGDQIVFVVEVLKMKSRIGMLKGEAYVEGNLVAEAEMKFSLVDR